MINTFFIAQDGFFPLRIRDNVEDNIVFKLEVQKGFGVP